MTGLRPLPSLKGYPEQIQPTLSAVKQTQDLPYPENRKELVRILSIKLPLAKSPTLRRGSRAKPDNLIFAQAIPTCQILDLISLDRKRPRLLHSGRVLDACKSEDEFRSGIATVVYEFDLEKAHIIRAIRDSRETSGDSVDFESLAVSLRNLGIDPKPFPRSTRLQDTLQFYDYSGLIILKKDSVYLKESRVNEVSKTKEPYVSRREFFQTLYNRYKELLPGNRGSPYVPIIPGLQEYVCDSLGIGENTFVKNLFAISRMNGKRIVLSPPMTIKPKHEVISVGPSKYYFISIYGGH